MEARESYRELFEISGRVAVVTGATGILGSQYVKGLAQFGAHVVIADRDGEACTARAREIEKEFGPECLGVCLDVTDPSSVLRMIEKVEGKWGRIDILVNNAATKGATLADFFASTESYALATWREVMAVNLDGVFLVSQAIGPRMADRGSGSIINVSSIYGSVGPDPRIYEGSLYNGLPINTPAVYSASKAGVAGLTRYFATLWANRGVRVNTLTPGGVESGQNDTFSRRYGERVPIGRMARADEMVGAIIFLASDASSYVNGHNLVVDGGWTAW